MKSTSLIRANVRSLHAYVPGEQPKIPGLIKLNTNENPFPPSPKVLAAVRAAVDQRLRLYPDPSAQPLREALAALHDCKPENIIVGNGSDELLALATRTFVEPLPAGRTRRAASRRSQHVVQFFDPSYSLYPVLTAIHNAASNPVALKRNFDIPSLASLKNEGAWDFKAALTLVTTPNAPSGRGYKTSQLEKLCAAQKGVIILDEAYADFAEENALELALRFPHVLVSRTFSKSYSLCFQRIGYFVGHPEMITSLNKIRDSYNVNGLGQAAALATLSNSGYYRKNFRVIKRTREWLIVELDQLGFKSLPSQANFVLTRPPRFSAEEWLQKLRDQKLLVRWFKNSKVSKHLRITIGTRDEIKSLLRAVRLILNS
jgi:histidinol-phosphate aminotransferase